MGLTPDSLLLMAFTTDATTGLVLGLKRDNLFVLAVALLTWGGVFFYLLRLDRLAKSLEEEVRARELDSSSVDSKL